MSLLLGIGLAILAQVMFGIGLGLEKKGAAALPNIEETSVTQNVRNFASNKLWIAGFALTTIQWFVYVGALAHAPLSLVAPFAGVGTIVLVLFSRLWLDEPIEKLEGGAISLIVGGLVLVGLNSEQEETPPTLASMGSMLTSPESLVFIALIIVLVVGLSVFTVKSGYKHADLTLGTSSGLLAGLGGLFSKAFSSGLGDLGGALWTPAFYLFLVLAGAGTFGSMVMQNMGFQKGRAVIVGPLFAVLSIVTPAMAGIVIFSEWGGLTPAQVQFQIIGGAIVCLGFLILSWQGAIREEAEKSSEMDSPHPEIEYHEA